MSKKDIISKQIIKRIAVDIAIYLLHLDINPDEVELLSTEQQRVEDRRADLVVKLKYRTQESFILHVEIQNSNEQRMPLRMMRYYTDIALQHPKLKIEQYVIYIGKRRLTMPAQVEGSDWCYRYRLIDMRSIDSEVFIEQDNPDALLLAVLCDFKGRDAQEMVNYIVQRLQALFKDDTKQFREYFMMLDILSDNRDLKLQVKKANEMLTQFNIEDLLFYQIAMERGMKNGIEQGIEKGIEKGELTTIRRIAKDMIAKGLAISLVAELVKLSEEELLKLLDSSKLN